MKKCKFISMLFAIVLGAFILTGCSQDSIDEALIGTWSWEFDQNWSYVFDEDGTGFRNGANIGTTESFEWSVVDNELRMGFGSISQSGIQNEVWAFSINDGILRLHSTQNPDLLYYYIYQH